MTIALDARIVKDPNIVGGKPRIAGRRITVKDIVVWHELLGKHPDIIAEEYDLSLTDIYTALAYYYAHQKEIDLSIKETDDFVASLKKQIPSKIEQKSGGK